MDNIDEAYAAEKGISLINAPEGNSDAVGEHAHSNSRMWLWPACGGSDLTPPDEPPNRGMRAKRPGEMARLPPVDTLRGFID